ncbi:hypothetical protein C8Q77DRAFT_7757 [Trametes polyzona]|nr:hypothetical protein C8Q77DRAFT_7757 [Trametes polyzona]
MRKSAVIADASQNQWIPDETGGGHARTFCTVRCGLTPHASSRRVGTSGRCDPRTSGQCIRPPDRARTHPSGARTCSTCVELFGFHTHAWLSIGLDSHGALGMVIYPVRTSWLPISSLFQPPPSISILSLLSSTHTMHASYNPTECQEYETASAEEIWKYWPSQDDDALRDDNPMFGTYYNSPSSTPEAYPLSPSAPEVTSKPPIVSGAAPSFYYHPVAVPKPSSDHHTIDAVASSFSLYQQELLQCFADRVVAVPAPGSTSTRTDGFGSMLDSSWPAGIPGSQPYLEPVAPPTQPAVLPVVRNNTNWEQKSPPLSGVADMLVCPYASEGCKYQTSSHRRYNLEQHIRGVHLGERPYPCPDPDCTESFKRSHDCKRHYISFHTDEGSPRRN